MAVIDIARMGHPVLRRRADAVADPTAPDIRQLVEDMVDSMRAAGGVGLAAPQIKVSRRVVIFTVPEGRAGEDPDDTAQPLMALINPEIEALTEETKLSWEGCLSLPGLRGAVSRPARIRYRGWTLEGQRFERVAGGFHATVVQHECDHLDGILYPQRMTDMSLFGFKEEWDEAFRAVQAQATAPTESERRLAAEAERFNRVKAAVGGS
ncbi:MAG: peptide deformylase [Alphaproteobacteria bacterium]|nr:peptide deformylase [Alphaproteobacteria bacterium]